MIQVPSAFKPFEPRGEVTIYTRNLPHWRQTGATYFVTFRLADAVPKAAKLDIQKEIRDFKKLGEKPDPGSPAWLRYHRKVTQRVERLLDENHGSCVLGRPEFAGIVLKALEHRQGIDYDLWAYTLMPNHVHLIVRPDTGVPLEDSIQTWKSVSARRINRAIGRRGTLWQQEYYDRIFRDDVYYVRVAPYIRD